MNSHATRFGMQWHLSVATGILPVLLFVFHDIDSILGGGNRPVAPMVSFAFEYKDISETLH